MAGSTSNLDNISESQAAKETTANQLFDALSPSSLFGRRASTTTGVTWGYYGGTIMLDGVLTVIANGTVALTISTTNYVQATRAGGVSVNTTGFTAGQIPLYTIVVGAATVTSYSDHRAWVQVNHVQGLLALALSDVNTTLTAAQARNNILQFTGALTATRNIVVPLMPQQWTVYNNTSGAQSLQFIGATGTGITVANGKRAIIYSDGTNVVRVTADNP